MTDAITLKNLAMSGNREALEGAWLERLESPGPAAHFVDAINALAGNKRGEVATALLPLVLETYIELGRKEDALAVARCLGDFQPDYRPLRRTLVKLVSEIYRAEPWISVFLNSCGLDADVPIPEAFALFDSYGVYMPGCPVEHKAGWGPGVVDGYNTGTDEVRIRFHDGAVREFPLSSLLDSLPSMDPDDLRAMLLTDPETVKEMAESDPALLVRKAVALRPGRVTAAQVKEALVDKAVPAKQWSKWWPKAKKAAARDPYIKVEGGSRPVYTLRDVAVSMDEEMFAVVERTATLADAVREVRAILPQGPDKELLEKMLGIVSDRVVAGADSPDVPTGVLLDAALLLEEKGKESPVTSADLFQEAVYDTIDDDGTTGTGLRDASGAVALLAEIPADRGRREGLAAFVRTFPGEWPHFLTEHYDLLPVDLLTPSADLVIKDRKGRLLSACWQEMEHEPWKHPWPLYHLGRKVFNGDLKGDDAPGVPTVVLTLLRCLESTLFYTQNERLFTREVIKRYEDLLFNQKLHAMDRFIEEGDRPTLMRAYKMVNVMSKVPKSVIDRLVTELPVRFPDLKTTKEAQFWETGGIFCSRAGVEKRRLQLQELVEVKLPENAIAIGVAASHGDLSENAEWEAAVEEQRLLSTKAKQMNEELVSAQFLEEQILPEGMVAPGTRVRYREQSTGEEKSFAILGPWDVGNAEDVISYQAPLAAGILGRKVGEEAVIALPAGELPVTILAVEPAL